ncbi:ABC transporter substrate-binding protein [Saccharopolyspora spinosa]|uniref:ABC transporter substrate-binding protein n=1 Tax=Saccharopolyspora spinosa TaxID=60894 RepID=UPI001EEF1951|nr:ABC transporter substrate-binding protein [Saccharopolyspora spinosa]
MTMRKRRVLAAVLVATSLLGVAACSGVGQGGGDQRVLVIASGGEIPALDPQSISGTVGLRVTDAIYETLVREDLDTQTKTAPEVRPALAESWNVSADGRVYTFKIRDGVTFHDGTSLDAAAIATNFDRLMDDRSPVYNQIASANMKFVTRWIASAKATGDLTFTITLKKPFAELPRLLTDRRMAIISPVVLAKYPGDAVGRHPDGTGPFRIESVEQGTDLHLEANVTYWRGAPKVDGLVFVNMQDPTTTAMALQTGEIDVIPSASAEQIAQLQGKSAAVVQYPAPANQYFIRLNTKTAPTDNPQFRQALNYAIDRDGIIAAVDGMGQIMGGPIPVGNDAFQEGARQRYEFNPDEARRLIHASGVQLPAVVKVYAPSGGPGFSQASQIMSLVQQDLKNVDVQLDVEYVEFTSLVNLEAPGYKNGVNGSFNGWTTGADSGYWLERMFGADQIPPAGVNRGWYVNTDLARIFDQARNSIEPETRRGLYREAADIIADDAPWVFLYQDRLPRIFRANITGIHGTPSVFVDYATISKS